jgi:hypothetical protein
MSGRRAVLCAHDALTFALCSSRAHIILYRNSVAGAGRGEANEKPALCSTRTKQSLYGVATGSSTTRCEYLYVLGAVVVLYSEEN